MPAQTKRQHEVLELITRYFETNGYRPSYQRIARQLGLRSRAGIARIVQDLETQGLLERSRENGHFTIKIQNSGASVMVSWLENFPGPQSDQAPLLLPSFILGQYDPADIRAFRVLDSALEPEIDIDDIALIELREFCRDGQRVIAVLNETESVLRKYYRVNSEVELRGSSERTERIVLAANRVRIIGVYRGLVRPAA